ncbi:MAG: DUF488 domain-containing protein [Chloroflexi bacterium]|nr:DUF488 domain-containing protein [Ardenticatenaceae bacterium]MBL1129311.1 DUF488 domain-containing protein [Chloroflexota bacterium]NOG35387.1 DUF488 domain-containing protein [Chloroflexota bacterium]GIK58617.1 MAG: hypothetical protein BroJett015_42800 [Chloroflexota bacterium]
MKLVTIGAFGFSEEGFFQALQEAGVDTFCDVRQRRGVRGAEYAFVNSHRLQARLAEMGIRYLHVKELAPTTAVRAQQHLADKTEKTAKRQRTHLSPAFIATYKSEILNPFDPQSLRAILPPDAEVVALFCVEREPAACHRSLIAERLAQVWGVAVENIISKQ